MTDIAVVDLCKTDTVKESLVLMDATALASHRAMSLESLESGRAARIDMSNGAWSAEFAPPLTDWRQFDQLVLVLRVEGGAVRPSLSVTLGSRTEGLPENDSLDSGSGAVLPPLGEWTEYPFPWENFLIYGMGELVNPVRSMRISFSTVDTPARVWISSLRLDRRVRATGPRMTDAGLRMALSEKFDGHSLLAHLRDRSQPRHHFDRSRKPQVTGSVAAADEICRNLINGYEVGDPVDWHVNPNGYLEWMHHFNRHTWLKTLTSAYRETGDPRYIRKLDDLWLSWMRDNPEPVGHNGGGDPAWETLSVAVRIYGFWLEAFFSLLEDQNFRDTTRIEILKSLHGHAEHLMAHRGHANNWLIVESRVLFTLGLLFPEFKRSEAWLAEGIKRLSTEIERQVWPDGADWELAPGYHMMACGGFLETLELARLNGLSLPPLFERRLPATFDYIAGMTRPDGSLPSVNDSGGWRGRRGGDAWLRNGARLFDRQDLKQSPEGPYAGRSRFFPDSGFHVLASGTGRQAMWSFIDGGPPGASHCHDDALNIEFFAHGLPFIVDPGISGYLRDNWTAYYRGTEAHNTVLVNGSGQDWARRSHDDRTVPARGRVLCTLGRHADVVRCAYDRPYRGQPAGIVHVRTLLLVRGMYWVVFDEVRGEAANEMEARFQFVPLRLSIDRRRGLFRTMRLNLPNLELRILAPLGRPALSVATGQTRPVGGWVSDGEDVPAPQARVKLTRDAAAPTLRLVTVVYPFAYGINSGIRTRIVKEGQGDTIVIGIDHADGRNDRICCAWDDRSWSGIDDKSASPLKLHLGDRRLCLGENKWRHT